MISLSFNPCFNGSIFQTRAPAFPWPQRVVFVSILVLMEVSFRLTSSNEHETHRSVSILVLMEVSFRQHYTINRLVKSYVSILVLMEVSFRQRQLPMLTTLLLRVSILVLMEVSFRLGWLAGCQWSRHFCFNPCFNGSIFQTASLQKDGGKTIARFNPCFNGSIFQTRKYILSSWLRSADMGFNPCFNGSIFQTYDMRMIGWWCTTVSILVLMEVSFRLGNIFYRVD